MQEQNNTIPMMNNLTVDEAKEFIIKAVDYIESKQTGWKQVNTDLNRCIDLHGEFPCRRQDQGPDHTLFLRYIIL